MTKTQAISALIISRIAQGQSAQQAFDAVIGAGAYERLAGEVWEAFQAAAKSGKA
jgi:Skp family chaperone for outer membrane proteins